MQTSRVPPLRLARANDAPVAPRAAYVLYWMTAARRTTHNFGMQRAVEWARELGKPLVVLEALRCDYRWASDRLHRFVIDGMADNARALSGSGVGYYPYVEPTRGAGKGLLAELASQAAVVVTDEFPSFFLPRMVATAARHLPVRLETVDGNGLLPLRATQERVFPTAYAFRRFLQRELPNHLLDAPVANPLRGVDLPAAPRLPRATRERWPAATRALLEGNARALAHLPLDHSVPVAPAHGGTRSATTRLRNFVRTRLDAYAEQRNDPTEPATSRLSPYLHFGHLAPHAAFQAVARHEGWSPDALSERCDGRREGWWGMRPVAEAFLDQLITWRELGYNMAFHQGPASTRYDALPEWAQATLDAHAADPRPHRYTLRAFERAATHDPVWNAAQRQLLAEGVIHNYLRMLWGKKILEWSRSPRKALEIMVELNNKYALDGRNPNSYSGIFWVLGRYDRPWGPERPIFGKVRYMSSENTARKLRLAAYLERYGKPARRA